MRFLAGQVNPLAGAIAVGTGTTPAAISDSRLTYEFDRATIYLTSPDYITKRIIFKGSIGELVVGTIHEVGLYSTPYGSLSTGVVSRSLATFERDVESWSTDTFASGNHRIGFEALRFAPALSATVSSVLPSVNLDLSSYSNTDIISVAYHSLNTNTSSIRLRFRAVDPASYFEYTITNPATGYNVASFTKSALTKVGTIGFDAIDSLEISVSANATGAAQVDVDGVRVETTNLDIDNVLISHSVLATPVVKTGLSPMDIEYALEVNL